MYTHNQCLYQRRQKNNASKFVFSFFLSFFLSFFSVSFQFVIHKHVCYSGQGIGFILVRETVAIIIPECVLL